MTRSGFQGANYRSYPLLLPEIHLIGESKCLNLEAFCKVCTLPLNPPPLNLEICQLKKEAVLTLQGATERLGFFGETSQVFLLF